MDRALIDKYIEEMRAMQAAALPEKKPTASPQESENSKDMSGEGGLAVFLTAVRGLYPVENGKVVIFTGSEQNMEIIAEEYTNESGKTPVIRLPAVSSVFSEAPNPTERPFAYYNIKSSADGYIDTLNYNVAVFDNVTSVQTVPLYPIASRPDNSPIIIDEFDNYEL